jgi:SAM-dependent methyltransferase
LLLDRLCLAGGEHLLEIGCGTAAVTLPLARAVGERGRVVAVDISEPMLEVARQRVAESGLCHVTLLLGDAQLFAFERAAFDIATSRMGVMFFAEPVTAFRNIRGALKPGGRLVFACWAPLAENRHWLISYEIAVRLLGPPAISPEHEVGPLAFGNPNTGGGWVRGHQHRTSAPHYHRWQRRGGGTAGSDDGPDRTADRNEETLRSGPAEDR